MKIKSKVIQTLVCENGHTGITLQVLDGTCVKCGTPMSIQTIRA